MNTRKRTISLTKLLIIEFITVIIASVFVFHIESVATESEKKEELFQKLTSIKSYYNTSALDMSNMLESYENLFVEEAQAFVYVHNHIDGFSINDKLRDASPSAEILINPSPSDSDDTYYSAQCEDGTVYALNFADEDDDSFIINTISDQLGDLIDETLAKNDLIFIANKKGEILFYPQDYMMEGEQVSQLGFEISDLELEDTTDITINGEKYYTAASYDKENDLVYIYAIQDHIFNANNRICASVICAAMVIIVTMIITYSYFSRQDIDEMSDEERQKNTKLKRKDPLIIGVLGLLLFTVIAFHIQSLFSVSVFSMQKNNERTEIESIIERHVDRFTNFSYINNFVNNQKAMMVRTLLEEYPELHTKEHVMALKSIFNLTYIHLYDSEMKEIVSTEDYKDQYKDYENEPIFQTSIDYAITTDTIDELSLHAIHSRNDYITVESTEESYYVSIGYPLDTLSNISDDLEIFNVLENVFTPGENEIVAVDPETKLVVYSTLSGFTGSEIRYVGIPDEALKSDSFDQFNLSEKSYYSSSFGIDDKMIFLLHGADSMFDGRTEIVLSSAALYALCAAFLLFLLNKFSVTPLNSDDEEEEETAFDRILDKFYTFFGINDEWSDKSAEEKALIISKTIFHILSFVIIGIVVFRNSLSDDNTVFGFVVQNKWAKGFNIFSLTAVTVVCFVYNFIISIVYFLFRKLFMIVSPRSETFLRMIRSFSVYATMLALLFYCLYLLGLNPTSLLASAGLAGVVISFGAKDLITDILAGLFIIFENQFQVGEVIEVGSDAGSVMEIGVRTTRLRTASGDILCIGNRNLTSVLNKTRTISSAGILISVSYKQNLIAIENMLREELPKLQDIHPNIISGPDYIGIFEFTDRYARMLISFKSAEKDRFSITCLLNAELCRLFDEHGFQMGIKPIEYKD